VWSDLSSFLLRENHLIGNKLFHLALVVLAVLNFQNKWKQREIIPVITPVKISFVPKLFCGLVKTYLPKGLLIAIQAQ
tara:strand:- start:162 stop:395 length:234 start_codon:yes stop_codon:yes gene_type:complete